MEKNNKWILIVLIIITLCVVGVCVYSVLQNNNDNLDTDAMKFRDEYTELNGKINTVIDQPYTNVTISDKNTVKYVSEDEAVELLKNGTGVIYFGFSTCPWCRSLVTPLTKVAENKNETIYYLDILDIRSSFEISDEKLNKIKEGTKGYYEILELLDEKLQDFYLEDEAGNKYDTKEKRLYAPTLVAFNKGDITSFHVGTVKTQESGYNALSEDEIKELEETIEKVIDSKNENEVCTSEKC